jgi:hypothetical protein
MAIKSKTLKANFDAVLNSADVNIEFDRHLTWDSDGIISDEAGNIVVDGQPVSTFSSLDELEIVRLTHAYIDAFTPDDEEEEERDWDVVREEMEERGDWIW